MELLRLGFLQVTVWDVVDILLVAFLFQRLYRVMRGTIAAQIFVGLLVILSASFLAQAVNLRVLAWLLRALTDVWVIVFVVLFQPELRRLLLLLGRNPLVSALIRIDVSGAIDEIVAAAGELAAKRHGALMVLVRTTTVEMFADTGVSLEAAVSKELLVSIFNPTSPLHDGAVIIKDHIISSARTVLPLSATMRVGEKMLGTRHRAALGISEQADVVVVIVSEENGTVSFAQEGSLDINIDRERLRTKLYDVFGVTKRGRSMFGRSRASRPRSADLPIPRS
jgi:diadenylate cyclase